MQKDEQFKQQIQFIFFYSFALTKMKFVLLLCLAILSMSSLYLLSILSPFPFFTQPLHYLFVGASITCDEPKTAYTVVRTYKSNSAEENIEIWEGASNTGVRVLFESGVSHENSVVNYEVCLSPAVHTFVCTDGYSFLSICPLFAK